MAKGYKSPAGIAAAARGDFLNAGFAETPGAIERQEAEGQRLFTSTFDRLPARYHFGSPDGTSLREALTKLGFEVHEQIDDLFVRVTPPEGWRLEPTDHAMWSRLLDDKGNLRGDIFYKAAFYDREAKINLLSRYDLEKVRLGEDGEPVAPGADYVSLQESVRDKETGEITFAAPPRPVLDFATATREEQGASFTRADEDRKACLEWLYANRPDWQSYDAYWGEEAKLVPAAG